MLRQIPIIDFLLAPAVKRLHLLLAAVCAPLLLLAAELGVAAIPPIGPAFRPAYQRGVCFTHNHNVERGYGSPLAARSLSDLAALGADSVSITPIGYSFNVHDPRIFGYTGEDLTMTPEAIRQTIRDAHAAGLRVTLTPHIWIGMHGSRGDWRGEVRMKSETDWRSWFDAYTEFILFFARMAQEENVELFSVGSEMHAATQERPEDWRRLISKVRATYQGPCTYSANWADEMYHVAFWDQLEYIGISAYFPIGEGTLEQCLARAAQARTKVAELATKHNKPVLFLEAGFRSVRGAGDRPHAWRDDATPEVDFERQRLGYETLFRTFRDQPWFHGFYWWQWFADPEYRPQPPTDFQFRDKPAETVLRHYFAQPNPRAPNAKKDLQKSNPAP